MEPEYTVAMSSESTASTTTAKLPTTPDAGTPVSAVAAAATSHTPIATTPATPKTATSFSSITPPTGATTLPSIIVGKKKKRVTDLKCNEVRWFLKKDTDTKWSPLKG